VGNAVGTSKSYHKLASLILSLYFDYYIGTATPFIMKISFRSKKPRYCADEDELVMTEMMSEKQTIIETPNPTKQHQKQTLKHTESLHEPRSPKRKPSQRHAQAFTYEHANKNLLLSSTSDPNTQPSPHSSSIINTTAQPPHPGFILVGIDFGTT
jgi:hypothetical protein